MRRRLLLLGAPGVGKGTQGRRLAAERGAIGEAEMVREFFAEELERRTQVPIVGFERLPAGEPGERVYKITTGPSAEPRVWPVMFSLGFGAYDDDTPLPLGILLYTIQDIPISNFSY